MTSTNRSTKLVFTLREFAELTGLSTRTLERCYQATDGSLPYLRISKVGNKRVIRKADADDFLDRLPAA